MVSRRWCPQLWRTHQQVLYGQHNVTDAIRHRKTEGMFCLRIWERHISVFQVGSENNASIVAHCVDTLERLQGQGVNEEVIKHVAGTVYFGKSGLLDHTQPSTSSQRSAMLDSVSICFLKTIASLTNLVDLDKCRSEHFLPGDGSQHARSEESAKTVGRCNWRG